MGGGEWIKWRMLCARGEIVSAEEKSEPYESPVYGKCRRIFHVANVVEGTIIDLRLSSTTDGRKFAMLQIKQSLCQSSKRE